jgi:UDP-N-acetylmuramoyl-L-alanyl-D-glutamate--2,6-diaminopimelate ligase
LLNGDAQVATQVAALQVTGLTADSREVKPGYVFAALPGTQADGTKFLPQAFAAGAVAAIAAKGTRSDKGPIIEVDNPRRVFSLMAARFHGKQPELAVAVTGTNGKTSVAAFTREIWQEMGFRAASIGTIGVVGPSGTSYLGHTTPDPMHLHEALAALADDHVKHLVMEASSHGLAQYRLDGVRLAAGAFTNLTRDHLDYHATLEDYFSAKMRLFDDLLPQGSAAVINADSEHAAEVSRRAAARGLRPFGVGHTGTGLRVITAKREGFGHKIEVKGPERSHHIYLPLVGDFQLSNALVAAGLVIATGGEETLAMHALESLKGARGRLELVGKTNEGAPVFVDYAHTPDALENALSALRPYARGRLAVVFGAGGDRDRGKRPLMGAAAAKLADRVIVTDDNPRTEDPALIRAAVLAAAPGAAEIGNRAEAIATAVRGLEAGDVLLVAGKGHEEGQTIGKETVPFSDHEAVTHALRGEPYHG